MAEGDRAVLEAAKLYSFPRLNGMRPEAMVAELAAVQRLDALYRIVPAETIVDIPRLSTGIAGVMSKKPADTIAALEMLDQLRRSGGSEAFWTELVRAYSDDRLPKIFLVAHLTFTLALRAALRTPSPQVHPSDGP